MGLILGTEHLAANANQPLTDHGHKRTPIKVALLSLPPRTQSLLEFFFSNAGRGSFAATIEEQAETAIFDLDTPASRDHWVIYNARTGRPGIALAVKPQEVSGAIWVQKPVTPAALLAAAASLRAGPLTSAATTAPEPTPAPWLAEIPAPVLRPAPVSSAPDSSIATPVVNPAPPAASTQAIPAPMAEQLATSIEQVAQLPEVQAQPSRHEATPDVASIDAGPSHLPMQEPSSLQTGADTPATRAPDHGIQPETGETALGAERQPALKSFWQRLFGTAPRVLPAGVDLELPAATGTASASPAVAALPSAPDAPADHVALPGTKELAVEPQSEITEAVSSSDVPPADTASTAPSAAPSSSELAEVQEPTASTQPEAAQASDATVGTDPTQAFSPTEPQLAAPSTAEVDLLLEVSTPATHAADVAFFGAAKGPAGEADATAPTQRYEPENYLIGALREAYLVASKWQVPTQIECEQGHIVVDAERNELHCGFGERELQALASQPLGKRSKVQTLTKLEYGKAKQDMAADGRGASCLRLDDSLWRCALWASAGRMPAGADATRTVYLRHWPNLTRLTPLPNAARLAAMWALRGSSVVDSARQFKIEQRFVIGFFNGVWALNLLTDDGSLVRRAQRKGARNRGLLTRLLGWLRG